MRIPLPLSPPSPSKAVLPGLAFLLSALWTAPATALTQNEGLPALGQSAPPSEGPRLGQQTPSFEPSDLRTLVQLDTGHDGVLWAFGGSYKASFGPDGAAFIPSFGADAPRNFPVRFGPPTVALNGTPLESNGSAAPVWRGHSAIFDRGPVEERYDVRSGELEQLFVFRQLAERGAITVRTPFVTELEARAGNGDLRFAGNHGEVAYTHAIAYDASGASVPVSTTLEGSDIVLRVPADFVRAATLPLTIDPVISTIGVSSNPSSPSVSPDIAYDGTINRWLVVWEIAFSATDHDIYAEAFSASGLAVPGSGAFVYISNTDWRRPRVAQSGVATQFLVVAQRSGAFKQVFGRTREAESVTMGPQLLISTATVDCINPDVGGNSDTMGAGRYCVVWERVNVSGSFHAIEARIVATNGTAPSPPIAIGTSLGTYNKVPSISKSVGSNPEFSRRWNIVWQREVNSANWDIWGAQVGFASGQSLGTFPIDNSARDDRWPSASSLLNQAPYAGQRPWLATWERRNSNGDHDIHVAHVRPNRPITSINLSKRLIPADNLTQALPQVDTNGEQFVVVWTQRFPGSTTNYDIFGASVYLAGEELHVSEGPVGFGSTFAFESQVQIGSRRSGGLLSDRYGVVWQQGTGAASGLRGSIFESVDHYGSGIGANYCGPAVPNSAGTSARILATGSSVAGGEPLTMTAANLPANQFGFFFASPTVGMITPPNSVGPVCVGNPVSRFIEPSQILNSGNARRFSLEIDTLAIPVPTGGTRQIMAGETMRFQAWFRDGGMSNLTDAVAVTFF